MYFNYYNTFVYNTLFIKKLVVNLLIWTVFLIMNTIFNGEGVLYYNENSGKCTVRHAHCQIDHYAWIKSVGSCTGNLMIDNKKHLGGECVGSYILCLYVLQSSQRNKSEKIQPILYLHWIKETLMFGLTFF